MKRIIIEVGVGVLLLGCGVWIGANWAAKVTTKTERLDDCIESTHYVRTLRLLQRSNAQQVDSNMYAVVTHTMENQIDWYLAGANDYLVNSNAFIWKLHDHYYGGVRDMLDRDLPSVVEYRDTHPAVWNHGPCDFVMKKDRKPNKQIQNTGTNAPDSDL